MTRIEQIYAVVLPEMAAHGISDTTSNRIAVLTQVYEDWSCNSYDLDREYYRVAIALEILALKVQLSFDNMHPLPLDERVNS